MMHVGTVADAQLEMLQHESFSYFLHETNPNNGLVIDKTAADWPASIAATGFALAAYPVAVERGFMPRAAAVERTLTTLRFSWNSPQGPEPDATGYQGFYYHFLDMRTGMGRDVGCDSRGFILLRTFRNQRPAPRSAGQSRATDRTCGCIRRPVGLSDKEKT
jgi:hypothetical protein